MELDKTQIIFFAPDIICNAICEFVFFSRLYLLSFRLFNEISLNAMPVWKSFPLWKSLNNFEFEKKKHF